MVKLETVTLKDASWS